MKIIPFQGLFPNLSLIPDKDRFFATVKEQYRTYYDGDSFLHSSKAAFYIIRISNPHRTATGLICTTHIDDYLSGKVMRHEKIIHQKEQIQLELLEEREAVVKPILLLHRPEPTIKSWLHDYVEAHDTIIEMTFDGGEIHQLWEVSASTDMSVLQSLFQDNIPFAAIADGHHRFSSFTTLAQENSQAAEGRFSAVLSAYFSEEDLTIDAFHRLVEVPRPFHELEFLEALKKLGSIELLPAPKLPQRKYQLSIGLSTGWYAFSWDPEILETDELQPPPVDVNLLDQYILQALLEVDDVQSSTRIHYLEGNSGIPLIEKSLQIYAPAIGFALYPIQTTDFLTVVSHGLQLVPKATFFEPRLRNGLIVQVV